MPLDELWLTVDMTESILTPRQQAHMNEDSHDRE